MFVVGVCPIRAMAAERPYKPFQWVIDNGLGGSGQQLYS
jgi:hypothetical protein